MKNYTEEIPVTFHPRAFSAFGSDLVTNDSVAVAELVKNCYDAFAFNVTVTIASDFIEIKDDGLGMSKDIIKNAWAVVATPYKKKNPIVEYRNKIRVVSGNKGLGRFSAARLGRFLEIRTKSENEDYITAKIDWNDFENASTLEDCKITISTLQEENYFSNTGTAIKITGLYDSWDNPKIEELKNSLARLVSPFDQVNDFTIVLNCEAYDSPVKIKPLSFIQHPTYSIAGNVTDDGTVKWEYKYSPKASTSTKKQGEILWPDSCAGFDSLHNILKTESINSYEAGAFSFEIRAWDLDADSVADVSETFKLGKREIRSGISQYKGLSIYRDGILVLPKSDASKDWLGIDIRRVSNIGKRISTSQIVGMINISAGQNPGIKDTTDREKLVSTTEYNEFCKVIETIITLLENLRYSDKKPKEKKARGLSDLISPLSANALVNSLEHAVYEGKSAEDLLDTVRIYAAENENNLSELNERLTYYAQTASLGSVAVVILHEVLTGMTVIKRFLNRVKIKLSDLDERTIEYFNDSEIWHARLVDVAKSFAPLYRKNLHKEKGRCDVNKEVLNSIRLIESKKEAKDVDISFESSASLQAGVFPGELQTILINLFDNALYWIKDSKKEEKKILVSITLKSEDKILVTVSDSGSGIIPNEAEQIFQPGITSKPGGIGMGLVIVTELLNNYGCKIATIVPGLLGGATFQFELPVERMVN